MLRDRTLVRNLGSLGPCKSQAERTATNFRVASDNACNRLVGQADRQAALEHMGRKASGAFMGRLRDGGNVDHAVTIIAEEEIILDPEEQQVLRLSRLLWKIMEEQIPQN